MLNCDNIIKSYSDDGVENQVLKGVSLSVKQGEFVSVVGRSGSGKTSLLNIMSTLLAPDSGSLMYKDVDLTKVSSKELNRLRHTDFAVIFQFHYLLPYLTALENTLLPFMNSISPVPRMHIDKAKECLARVGLEGKEKRLPGGLSGGEQQRVAIARALVKDASVIFADEPTGSLDKKTGEGIMQLLKEVNEDGMAVIMVTHDPVYAKVASRTITMEDGRIVSDPKEVAERSKENGALAC
jgi:putative ABC transport system ATP-binding protein